MCLSQCLYVFICLCVCFCVRMRAFCVDVRACVHVCVCAVASSVQFEPYRIAGCVCSLVAPFDLGCCSRTVVAIEAAANPRLSIITKIKYLFLRHITDWLRLHSLMLTSAQDEIIFQFTWARMVMIIRTINIILTVIT